MKALKIVVFILAMFVLTTQAVRHVYVRFIEPRTSALDKYDQTETKNAIKQAASLNELLTQYEPAHRESDSLDTQLKQMKEDKTRDEIAVIEEEFREGHKLQYERESELKSAIRDWESKTKEILELRVFWAFGATIFLVGIVLQPRRPRWLGMSMVIPGIIEMIWWTCPSFGFSGCPREFDRLLINKLTFTLITIAVVIIWWAIENRRETREAANRLLDRTA